MEQVIDEKKLMEELIPILKQNGDWYLSGRIIGRINMQPKIDCSECIPLQQRQIGVDTHGRCMMRGCNLCDGYRKKLEEYKWIPCEERLPEKYGDYLVAIIPKAGVLWQRIMIARYSNLMGICVQPSFHIGEVGKDSFEKLEGVVAWQPLPQPYKKEGAE